jgi:hypothetical protein
LGRIRGPATFPDALAAAALLKAAKDEDPRACLEAIAALDPGLVGFLRNGWPSSIAACEESEKRFLVTLAAVLGKWADSGLPGLIETLKEKRKWRPSCWS